MEMGTQVKKDILFIIENLRDGGAEKALITLLKQWDYTRYNVTLCILFYEGIYRDEIPQEVKLIVLYKKRNSFCRKSFRYYQRHNFTALLRFQIKRKTKKHYDTIISFLEGRSLLFHDLIRERAGRNITWVHCDLPHYHWTTNAFYRPSDEIKCYTHMDEIVFVSSSAMKSFSDTYNIAVPKRCIYNLIDCDNIRSQAAAETISHSTLTITSIGSLNNIKAFDKLIRVAKLFQQNGYTLHFQIIGKGENEGMLRNLAKALNVEDYISFLGFKRNPYPYLKGSDIYISTSLSEGLPTVICEAFTLGIPVVATSTAGAVELLKNGEYGILTGHEETSIYEGLRTLIDDEDLRNKYAQKAQERARIFDMQQTINRIYNVITG